MSDQDLSVRIALLETHAQITDLVHRYAHAVRNGDGAEFGKLFTDDATFEVRDGLPGKGPGVSRTKLTGSSQILPYLAKSAAGSSGLSPLIHNLLIEVRGDLASSRCVMVGAIGAGVPRFMGGYEDSYRRGPDGWRFTARVFTIQGMQT